MPRFDASLPLTTDLLSVVHVQYVGHVILVCLMIALCALELETGCVPDAMTIPGTIVGLLVAGGFPWPVILGLTCLWLWCFVLVPKDWRPQLLGFRTAWKVLLTRMTSEPKAKVMLWTARLGSLGIIAAWWFGQAHWRGLLSGLVGMAAGGGLFWYVRVIGGACLRRETMGRGARSAAPEIPEGGLGSQTV